MIRTQEGLTCQVTSYRLVDSPADVPVPDQSWLAVATVHICNRAPEADALPTRADDVEAGDIVEVVRGTAKGVTETRAMADAVRDVLAKIAQRELP